MKTYCSIVDIVKMKAIVIAVLALCALAAVSAKNIKGRNFRVHPMNVKDRKIVGGDEASPHKYPYQCALNLAGGYFCGCSLISEEWVMTAAHCGELDDNPLVILGAHEVNNANEAGQVRVRGTTTVHEDWDSANLINDIALIKIPKQELNDQINTIGLPALGDNDQHVGDVATVTGWGLSSDSATGISPRLRVVLTDIITNPDCEHGFLDLISIPATNICLNGSEGKGTCSGDSGGPSVVDGKEVGITSFGITLGCEGYPSALTRVTSYTSWIQKISGVTG